MTITGKAENYKTAETLVCRVDNWDPWFVPLALLYRLCQADSACYCRVKVGGGGGGGGGDGGRVETGGGPGHDQSGHIIVER